MFRDIAPVDSGAVSRMIHAFFMLIGTTNKKFNGNMPRSIKDIAQFETHVIT